MSARHSSRLVLAARSLAAVVLVASSALVLALALSGFELVDLIAVESGLGVLGRRRDLLAIALILLLSALAVVGFWLADFRQARRLRDEGERDRRASEISKRWASRLRTEVATLRSGAGIHSASEDVTDLILSLALELVDADRGAILRRSGGQRAERGLTAAAGFEADPHTSAILHRFADEAIAADTIVRRDEPEIASQRSGPADEEIRNVTAIPIFVRDELDGVVVCANSERFGEQDESVLLALGDQAGAVLENDGLEGELREGYVATVRMLVEAIRAKDPHLGGHSEEVSGYVARVADHVGLDRAGRERLLFASLLHDIGKIGISERILLKPGRLSSEEFALIEQHPRIGSRLVERVPALAELATPILHHHERFDGEGYPSGLAGDQIPIESRVIGVADAFSAMTSDRPYRGRMSLHEACEELERCAGSQFDPRVVEPFVAEVRARPPAGEPDPPPPIAANGNGDGRGASLLGGDPLELTDSLTLLYTHRYFHELAAVRAAEAEAGGEVFAVLIATIGCLPRVNAEQGYAAGDEAIRRAARVIEDAAVRCGGTAARHGGSRLALLIPSADEAAAEVAALDIGGRAAADLELRLGRAAWRPGLTGDELVTQARMALLAPQR